MRITQRMMTGNAIRHMNENLQRLHDLQEMVASGKQFQRASDNPVGAIGALSIRSTLKTSQAYLETTQFTNDWMSATDFSLQQMIEVGKRAVVLTSEGMADTMGPAERQALATELNSLLKQAVDLGNSQHQGKYLFSGFKVKTNPFDPDGALTQPSVEFEGVMLQTLSPGQTITQNIIGVTIFPKLFQAITDARDALNDDTEPYDVTDTANALGMLQEAVNDINNEASTVNGARKRQVGMVMQRIEKTQIELKSLLSQKEDVNMIEAISMLRLQEITYQTVLEVGNRAISAINLFDILG